MGSSDDTSPKPQAEVKKTEPPKKSDSKPAQPDNKDTTTEENTNDSDDSDDSDEEAESGPDPVYTAEQIALLRKYHDQYVRAIAKHDKKHSKTLRNIPKP